MISGMVTKIWEVIGLITKEFRFLVLLVIIHAVSFFLIVYKINQNNTLWLFLIFSAFLFFYFFGFIWLYNRLAVVPYLVSYDLDGNWIYDIEANIDGRTTKVSGECHITRILSSIHIDGKRTRIYEDWEACQNAKNCIAIGKPECEICENCKKVVQFWSTTWGAITTDRKLRFDYYFDVGHQLNARGYCVLELRGHRPDKMHGYLMYLPPHGAPGQIVFKREPESVKG